MECGEKSIVFASHQSEDIQKLADYITILRSGEMIGHFEKEFLIENYRSYWLMEPIPDTYVPGVVSRSDQTLISDDPAETEAYLSRRKLAFTNSSAVDLEEIINIILTK